MINPYDNKKFKAWVVFTKTDYPHPVFKLLNKEYQHCYVVRKSRGGQFWVVANGMKTNLGLQLEPIEAYPNLRDLEPNATDILEVVVNISDKPVYQLGICSCVDVVKSALGIRDWMCLTPYKLYTNLIGGQYGISISARSERSKKSSNAITERA